MGDCLTRPLEKDFSKHYLESSDKNTDEFLIYPTLDHTSECFDFKLQDLESKLQTLKNYHTKIRYQYESSTHGITTPPYLNIEIQKGLHFYLYNTWSNLSFPYVKITLLPSNTTLCTSKSNLYYNNWYEFFTFSDLSDETVKITAYLHRLIGEDLEIGSIEFIIKDLIDQNIKEGWYKLTNRSHRNNLIPKVRIRMQFVHDLKSRLQSILDYTQGNILKLIQEIDKARDSISVGSELK